MPYLLKNTTILWRMALVFLVKTYNCVAAAARQSFKEQEALVYQQLAQLIRDGVWLKSYLAAVMRLEQEAFQVH